MKKLIFLLSIFTIVLFSNNLYAQIQLPTSVKDADKTMNQDIPDGDFSSAILKALNPGKSFTSPDKLLKLLGNNKDYVANILDVADGSDLDDEKMAKVDALKSERKDFIEQLLGEGKAADYYKLVKDQIEPLTKKFKLAKLFL
jgi:hypothetical protein